MCEIESRESKGSYGEREEEEGMDDKCAYTAFLPHPSP